MHKVNINSTFTRKGFVLPLALILVILLTVSGTSFLQHGHLERRMVMSDVDNHSAFYLASSGLERARAAFEIPEGDPPSWTPLLEIPHPVHPELCPEDPPGTQRGCVPPPFLDPVVAPDAPFFEDFDEGQYQVRATNDANDIDEDGAGPDTDEDGADAGTNDTDATITLHALGEVRGERKLLQVDVRAIHGLKLINCGHDEENIFNQQGTEEFCPQSQGSHPVEVRPLVPGKMPEFRVSHQLPGFVASFYEDPSSFPWIEHAERPEVGHNGWADLRDEDLHPNTHYFIEGNVNVSLGANETGIVIFSTGSVDIGLGANLENSVIVALDKVTIRLGDQSSEDRPRISAPPFEFGYFPAIISGGLSGPNDESIRVNIAMEIIGSIFAQAGFVQFMQEVDTHGVIIAKESFYDDEDTGPKRGVHFRQGGSATDDGQLAYYSRMRGFEYPGQAIINAIISGKWQEVE